MKSVHKRKSQSMQRALKGRARGVSQQKKERKRQLIRSPQNGLAVNAPEAYGHEFQSQGVIEMPKNRLLDQFIAGRTELKKEEMNT